LAGQSVPSDSDDDEKSESQQDGQAEEKKT